MPGRKINFAIVQSLKQQVDILEVISSYTSLTPQGGGEYMGLCPFHSERSPSFRVNQEKRVFHCFGCQISGDTISFLMEINNCNFTEAIEKLAQQQNAIPIEDIYQNNSEEESNKSWHLEQIKKKQLLSVNEFACSWFEENLLKESQNPSSKLTKFLRQRKLKPLKYPQFRLGYGGKDWQGLIDAWQKTHLKKDALVILREAGLVKHHPGKTDQDDHYYDIFRDRLIVPLFDARGSVIGFSGRILTCSESSVSPEIAISSRKIPKYLNSSDSLLFKKQEVIFPLHLARRTIKQEDEVFVVEGNFDVIQLHSIGIKNAIATLGSSLSDRQLKKLIALTKSKTIILALDRDRPGIKAIAKIIKDNLNLINNQGVTFKVATPPDNYKDWDEFISTQKDIAEGGQAQDLSLLIRNSSIDWVDWYIEQICNLNNQDLHKSADFLRINQKFTTLLSWIENLTLKHFYAKKCAAVLAQEDSSLIDKYYKGLITSSNQSSKSQAQTISLSGFKTKDLYKDLDNQQIAILSCEIILAKIGIFHPHLQQSILFCLQEIDWFIKDPMSRWSLRQVNSLIEDNISAEYYPQEIKAKGRKILQTQSLFEATPEFINFNYQNDQSLLLAKLEKICSQEPSEMIAIENPDEKLLAAREKLRQFKTKENIQVCKALLGIAKTTAEKQQYLTQINILKQQLIKK